MPICCKRLKQCLQGRFFDKFLPLNAFAINFRIEGSIQQDQNINLTQFCQQVHSYYIKEQKVNLLANTYRYKFTKPISMGLIDLLPKKTQYSNYSRSRRQRQEVMPQCIHTLELLSKDAETTYFSLDDVQTTYSSFMEDPNWSFIEDSLVANE